MINKQNFKYFLLLHLILLLYSFIGIVSKTAAMEQFLSIKFILLYGVVIFLLFVYALLWQQIIKKMPIITAFSNKAIVIVWGLIWGIVIFKEKITFFNIIGAVIIIVGVCIVIGQEEG